MEIYRFTLKSIYHYVNVVMYGLITRCRDDDIYNPALPGVSQYYCPRRALVRTSGKMN